MGLGLKAYLAWESGPGLIGVGDFYQDPPCDLNWRYMAPNSRYVGPNRGQEEGLGRYGSSKGFS